jgi:hypothetical protein
MTTSLRASQRGAGPLEGVFLEDNLRLLRTLPAAGPAR